MPVLDEPRSKLSLSRMTKHGQAGDTRDLENGEIATRLRSRCWLETFAERRKRTLPEVNSACAYQRLPFASCFSRPVLDNGTRGVANQPRKSPHGSLERAVTRRTDEDEFQRAARHALPREAFAKGNINTVCRTTELISSDKCFGDRVECV